MLIGRGTDESLDQAEKLLAINSVDESLDQDDQRLKAMLYMRRGGNDGREKARHYSMTSHARRRHRPATDSCWRDSWKGTATFAPRTTKCARWPAATTRRRTT